MAIAHHLDANMAFETRPTDDFTIEAALNALYAGDRLNEWTYRYDVMVHSIFIQTQNEAKQAHDEFVKIAFGGNVATYIDGGYVYQFGVYKGLLVRVLATNLDASDYETSPMIRPAEIAAALATLNETEPVAAVADPAEVAAAEQAADEANAGADEAAVAFVDEDDEEDEVW